MHAKAVGATGYKNGVEIFVDRVKKSPNRAALRYKAGGIWRTVTWSDWDKVAREVGGGLRQLGLATGDRVVLLSSTRPEWVHFDVGILLAGGVTVPIYPSTLADGCEYIVNDSGARLAVVEDPAQLAKLLEVRARTPSLERVVLLSDVAHLEKPDEKGRTQLALADVLPEGADRKWIISLDELRANGKAYLHSKNLDEVWTAVNPTSIFTIVYTSGTTGPPKGVVLTHANLVFECSGSLNTLHIGEEDEQLMFLPLAHILARILEWTGIARGVVTSFAESIPKLIDNMKEIRPTFMASVPRVFEKAYVRIQAGFAEKRKSPIARVLLDWALWVGTKYSRELQAQRRPPAWLEAQMRVADRLIFSKVKATFGGRLKYFVSGGAPLAREISEFFHACGLLILEGYGLTETTAATHINRPEAFRFGTVGVPIPGVECRIAPDGEILVRGPNVLQSYYKKPEATKEAIDVDGWFHTGDIGVVEDGGFLRITDRKKDIIVTAGGKNVAPQNIENAFKSQCPYVSQVMVHGDKRSYLVALVTLNEENIAAWARPKGITFANAGDLARHADVRTLLDDAVKQLNKGLASFETLKKFEILPSDLTTEAGELTPTLKVKRRFVSEKYRTLIDGMYASTENP